MINKLDNILNIIDNEYQYFHHDLWKTLLEEIKKDLDASGIMYRMFGRVKEINSVKEKLKSKYEKYISEDRGIRDLYGIRIVLYFKDDIDICINIIKSKYELVDKEHDTPDSSTFKPQRINYVFKIPDKMNLSINNMDLCMIENTFEVQIRTIFSEGWHEVEHDLRYKYSDKWENRKDLSRELNGLFATLEICDSDIINICERLSYGNYKNGEWESMIRNKFRLRYLHTPLRKEIVDVFSNNKNIAKEVYRFDRNQLIKSFHICNLPLNYDNTVYLINLLGQKIDEINKLTPEIVKQRVHDYKLT